MGSLVECLAVFFMSTTFLRDRRRSDRLRLAFPLQIKGAGADGKSFQAEGKTITVNRHGAHIQASHPLFTGQLIRILNPIAKLEAQFRVAGPMSPPVEGQGEYGVECLEHDRNIWGILFPPGPANIQGGGMPLECSVCNSLVRHQLSIVEAEVLQACGMVERECKTCGESALWRLAGIQSRDTSPSLAPRAFLSQEPLDSQRRDTRFGLQLPVRIRDFNGGVEITKTENVSRTGLCFASEKRHQVGEAIMVVCPYGKSSTVIEVRAIIARRVEDPASRMHLYGAYYDPARK